MREAGRLSCGGRAVPDEGRGGCRVSFKPSAEFYALGHDPALIIAALDDEHPAVRRHAVRIGESFLKGNIFFASSAFN